jgi:hypothetical protein
VAAKTSYQSRTSLRELATLLPVISHAPSAPARDHSTGSCDFRTRSTERIVVQLRVVADALKLPFNLTVRLTYEASGWGYDERWVCYNPSHLSPNKIR